MRKLSFAIVLALLLANALAFSTASAANEVGAWLDVPIMEQNGSGQMGTARLTETATGVTVHLMLNDAGPAGADVPQPAHIHEGSCPTPGKVKWPLSPVVNGMSETTIEGFHIEFMQEYDFAINVHKSAQEVGVYTACGDIPKTAETLPGAQPAASPTPTTEPAPDADQETLMLHLMEENGSGQTGMVTLIHKDDWVRVIIDANTGPAGTDVPQPAHIHDGSCSDLGGVEYPLNPVINGKSDTTIKGVHLDYLQLYPHAVNIHKSAQEVSVYTSCADIVPHENNDEADLEIPLNEMNGSGQKGEVLFWDLGNNQTRVVIHASAGPAGAGVLQPAHIHDGSCAKLGGVKWPLTMPEDGFSDTVVPVSLATIQSGMYAVNVHKSPQEAGVYTACGDIPMLVMSLPQTGGAPIGLALVGGLMLAGAGYALRRRTA